METKGNSYSTLTEKELFELLTHALSGTSACMHAEKFSPLFLLIFSA
jgi:hypothetical protein